MKRSSLWIHLYCKTYHRDREKERESHTER